VPDDEEDSGPSEELETSSVDLREIDKRALRLDAIHYAPSYRRAVQAIKRSGIKTVPLGDYADRPLFTRGRFKRIYVRDAAHGHPYLAPYELLNFKPFRERYLSRKLTEDAADYFVKSGWLLLTSSGTIGIPVIATKEKERYFLSHDLIRLVPKEDTPTGYLYAWLASRLAKSLFMRQEYGGIIKHIEAHHVQSLPVPQASSSVQTSVDSKIRKAWELREEANRLEREAISELDRLLIAA
jgi:type I restriction enzyme, S subunit